jgi:hypothetical protein
VPPGATRSRRLTLHSRWPGWIQGPFLRRLQAGFGRVGLPVAQVEAHGHVGFGRPALAQHGAVDQVGQPLGPHAAAGGQPEAEQHGIEDVALAGAVGAGDHREPLIEGDGDGAAEGFEVGELDLIDMNHRQIDPQWQWFGAS